MSIFQRESKTKKSITLYAVHLPILLLLFGVLAFSGLISFKVSSLLNDTSGEDELGFVLGKDDDGDEDDDDDDDDSSGSGKSGSSDDDDDDDSSGSSKSGSSDDDDDDDSSGSSKSGSSDDDDDEDEDSSGSSKSGSSDDDDDSFNSGKGSGVGLDDDSDEDRLKTIERTQNSDGTFTVVKREVDDDEIKYEVRTYDANGNKIRVEKFESDDDDSKSRVKIYDEFGNKLSDFRLETDDGKELELRLKEGDVELTRVIFDVDKQELVVKSDEMDDDTAESGGDEGNENRLRIRLVGDNFILTRQGVDALSRFPMVVDDETGQILVLTPAGEVNLGVMPDSIVEKAESTDDIDEVESLELASESTSSESAPLEFKLFGTKSERLLGLFNLQIPSTLIYDAETGDFLRSDQPFITKVLDLFSF